MELDACRLSQVLVNLISNAVKFTSAGEIKIKMIWRPDSCRKKDSGISLGVYSSESLLQEDRKLTSTVYYSTE